MMVWTTNTIYTDPKKKTTKPPKYRKQDFGDIKSSKKPP
jgi:hypothetical protein